METRTDVTTNGHGPVPEHLVEYLPVKLAGRISHILDREGMMQESAERQILTLLAANQKETQTSIAENHRDLQTSVGQLKDELKEDIGDLKTDFTNKLHGQDLRVNATDARVVNLEKAGEVAADERRDTKRLVKGAIIVSAVSILVGVAMSVWGPSAKVVPAVQQAVRQDDALSGQLKELIELIKTEHGAPVVAPLPAVTTRPKGRPRRPEPIFGPRINMLRPGEMITTKELPSMLFSSMRPPDFPIMGRP